MLFVRVFIGISMNKISKFFFSLIFLSIVAYGNESGFQKSREDELQETISYYAKLNDTSFEYAKTKMLAIAAKNFVRPRSIDQMIETSKRAKDKEAENFFSDIKSTFRLLKQKMNIPDEVNIVFCDDKDQHSIGVHLIKYHSGERTIVMYPAVFDLPQTFILFSMIHELTHVQQHMRDGLLQYTLAGANKASQAQKEREADTNAAQIIKCPLCLKTVLVHRLLQEQQLSKSQINNFKNLGYLISADLRTYLEEKDLMHTCKAHKNIININSLLGLDTQKNLEEIEENDYCGTIYDRLQ